MTSIWADSEASWQLLAPSGFPTEAALHDIVEAAVQILPLSGQPKLAVVGREVRLGSGYADLVAVDPVGEIALIEIKLAHNDDARRAIVAQVLAYAAYLDGMSVDDLQTAVLASHLKAKHWTDLAEAAETAWQGPGFNVATFRDTLGESLRVGRFRLVLVLDTIPAELIRLVAFLESSTANLTIDLVTISLFAVGERKVLVPQRVEPQRRAAEIHAPGSPTGLAAESDGSEEFRKGVEAVTGEGRPLLDRILAWATQLESSELARLVSVVGATRTVLRVHVPGDAGLVTLWNEKAMAWVSPWRSVFQRRAPRALEGLDKLLGPEAIGQGNYLKRIDDEVLGLITAAYREATGR